MATQQSKPRRANVTSLFDRRFAPKTDITTQEFSVSSAAALGILSGLVTYDYRNDLMLYGHKKGLTPQLYNQFMALDEKIREFVPGPAVTSDKDKVIIAFPGSAPYDTDSWSRNFNALMTDARGGTGRVHSGYYEALYREGTHMTINVSDERAGTLKKQYSQSALLDLVFDQIKAQDAALLAQGVSEEELSQRSIYLTGESQGGALALLAADDPRFEPYLDRMQVYTFNSPKSGDQVFAKQISKKLDGRIFNVSYAGDIAHHLPPSIMGAGYHHAGESWHLETNGTLKRNGKEVERLPGATSDLEHSGLTRGGSGIERGIWTGWNRLKNGWVDDHLPSPHPKVSMSYKNDQIFAEGFIPWDIALYKLHLTTLPPDQADKAVDQMISRFCQRALSEELNAAKKDHKTRDLQTRLKQSETKSISKIPFDQRFELMLRMAANPYDFITQSFLINDYITDAKRDNPSIGTEIDPVGVPAPNALHQRMLEALPSGTSLTNKATPSGVSPEMYGPPAPSATPSPNSSNTGRSAA